MTLTSGEARQLVEPTVLGAMRRHWLLVSLVVVACVDIALAFGALREDEYRATATVSAPRPAASALQSDAQYLDSQVLLLNSRQVGDRAHELAVATPAGAGIERRELAPTIGEVEIIPPQSGSTGSYGTTIVDIQFTAPSADEAQAGANALATAYDEVRSQEIADTAAARLSGIDRAIATAESPSDVAALREERVQALIDEGRDLSQSASISTAERPESPAGSGLLGLIAVGLFVGVVVGGAAAFVRASRLQQVGEARVAERVYGAPLLLERPSADAPGDDGRLTEPDRLLGRAVSHRLRAQGRPTVLAVVAPRGNRGRSRTAAALALALTEADSPVLAVDGADGTMAAMLAPGAVSPRSRAGRTPVPSPLHDSLTVLDLSASGPGGWDPAVLEDPDLLVVVDCPPTTTSAEGVDLLSHCDTAVVLVRADEPVREHVDLARWLDLVQTAVLGCVFSPHARRGLRDWWPGRRAGTVAARPSGHRAAQEPTTASPALGGAPQPSSTSTVEGARTPAKE